MEARPGRVEGSFTVSGKKDVPPNLEGRSAGRKTINYLQNYHYLTPGSLATDGRG